MKRTQRAYTAGVLVNAVGTGMYVPFSLIFFQHVTGLPLTTIGVVLTVTGLVAMAALPVSGILIDRFGALKTRQAIYIVRGISFLTFPLGTTLTSFTAIATIASAVDRAAPAAQQALIGEIADGADRDRLMALSRSVNNGGMGAGSLLAALLILLAGDQGFYYAAYLNAATFFGAALLMAGVKANRQIRLAAQKPSYTSVFRDRPYKTLTVANFLIALGYAALSMLLPAYAVTMKMPPEIAGPLFAVNTALCAFAGVPVGRWVRRARRTRAAALGAAIFAVSFVGYAAIGVLPKAAIPGALVALLVLYTVGELVHSPSAGTLSVNAAPEAARGRYLATYQLSWGLSSALAPSLFTVLLAVNGMLPWLVLALSATAGAAMLVALEKRLPAHVVQVPREAAPIAPQPTVKNALRDAATASETQKTTELAVAR